MTQLGDLQLAIMRVLWSREEASVAEVHGLLFAERGLATTTIATMLVKMERKGVVTHRVEGRRYIYRPTANENEVRRTMVGAITDRLFQGSTVALVSHLLEQHEVTSDEIEELKAILSEHEKEEND